MYYYLENKEETVRRQGIRWKQKCGWLLKLGRTLHSSPCVKMFTVL